MKSSRTYPPLVITPMPRGTMPYPPPRIGWQGHNRGRDRRELTVIVLLLQDATPRVLAWCGSQSTGGRYRACRLWTWFARVHGVRPELGLARLTCDNAFASGHVAPGPRYSNQGLVNSCLDLRCLRTRPPGRRRANG